MPSAAQCPTGEGAFAARQGGPASRRRASGLLCVQEAGADTHESPGPRVSDGEARSDPATFLSGNGGTDYPGRQDDPPPAFRPSECGRRTARPDEPCMEATSFSGFHSLRNYIVRK
jgi:hypothetical protein